MKTTRLYVTRSMAAVCSVALLLACGASAQPPNDAWAAAQADVGRAEQGGALRVPDAKLHLQLAREDLARSKQLIDNDNQRAATMITLARVEADLALSLARKTDAQEQARLAQQDLAKANNPATR